MAERKDRTKREDARPIRLTPLKGREARVEVEQLIDVGFSEAGAELFHAHNQLVRVIVSSVLELREEADRG